MPLLFSYRIDIYEDEEGRLNFTAIKANYEESRSNPRDTSVTGEGAEFEALVDVNREEGNLPYILNMVRAGLREYCENRLAVRDSPNTSRHAIRQERHNAIRRRVRGERVSRREAEIAARAMVDRRDRALTDAARSRWESIPPDYTAADADYTAYDEVVEEGRP